MYCYNSQKPKPKDIQYAIMYEMEKHQVFALEKLEPAHFCHFAYKKAKMIIQISK